MPPRAPMSEDARLARNLRQADNNRARRERQTEEEKKEDDEKKNAANNRTRPKRRAAHKKSLDEATAAAASGTATEEQKELLRKRKLELDGNAEYRRNYRKAKPEQDRDARNYSYPDAKARREAQKDAVYASGDPAAIEAYEAKKASERERKTLLQRMRRNPERYSLAEGSTAQEEPHEDEPHDDEGEFAPNQGDFDPADPTFWRSADHWNALHGDAPSPSHSLGQVKLSPRQSAIYRQSRAVSRALF